VDALVGVSGCIGGPPTAGTPATGFELDPLGGDGDAVGVIVGSFGDTLEDPGVLAELTREGEEDVVEGTSVVGSSQLTLMSIILGAIIKTTAARTATSEYDSSLLR